MEENKEYQAIITIIANLTSKLNAPEVLQQDFCAQTREIEEFTERCIHALRVRQQTLIDQLEVAYQQQDDTTSEGKDNGTSLLQQCHDLLKAGSGLFKFNQSAAERIWKEAKSLESPTTELKDMVSVSIHLPTDLLDLIAHFGAVTTQDLHGNNGHSTSYEQLPSANGLFVSLQAQNELLQQKYGALEKAKREVDADLDTLRGVNSNLQELNAKLQGTINYLETDLFHKNQLCEVLNDMLCNLQHTEAKLAEMEEDYSVLTLANNRLKMLEKIYDHKETGFQTLARAIGYETPSTVSIFRELANFSDHSFEIIKLLYHQITYWHALEFEDLPVLQTVIAQFNELLLTHSRDLEFLTHIFSGVSLLLYMFSKNRGDDMEDEIEIEPLVVRLKDPKKNRRSRGILGEVRTPDLRTSGNIPAPPKKLECKLLTSSDDFVCQLKEIVARCFGNLLAFAAEQIDPLLEKSIFAEDFRLRKPGALNMNLINSFLNELLSTFQRNLVHLTLSQQFFSQLFSRINSYLINGVLFRQQFCTDAFGKHLMKQMDSLQATLDEMGQMWVGDGGCLQGIKQVAVVLQHNSKKSLADERIRKATCPSLSSQQLRHLLSMYSPGTSEKRVPIYVIQAIGAQEPLDIDPPVLDINLVQPFPIKLLHYFEIEDMLQSAPSPKIREFVERHIFEMDLNIQFVE
eukprot:Phypoly_transcript_04532.p1 GENE.Phypoly_transcript_04532~~Phypoly_transcript_04532.p1  ORF type:complete len:686 (+),score=96.61 Phypoly_transcript_04532:100-2157(+)